MGGGREDWNDRDVATPYDNPDGITPCENDDDHAVVVLGDNEDGHDVVTLGDNCDGHGVVVLKGDTRDGSVRGGARRSGTRGGAQKAKFVGISIPCDSSSGWTPCSWTTKTCAGGVGETTVTNVRQSGHVE